MTFSPTDVLGVVTVSVFTNGTGVDRPTVDAGGGSRAAGFLPGSDVAAESIVDFVQSAIGSPLVEVSPDGTLGGEVRRETGPLATGAEDGEDGVHDVAHLGFSRTTTAGLGRETSFNEGPLFIGEIAAIVVCSHATSTVNLSSMFPLWDRL